jgi:hypothetical protein
MDEHEYWSRLEFRVCREFAGMPDGKLRNKWCDGFIPSQYLVTGRRPRIVGKAWICAGSQQAEWEFTLRLPRRIKSRKDIDWAALLPAEDVNGWLSLDEERRRITIEPGAAVPDPA